MNRSHCLQTRDYKMEAPLVNRATWWSPSRDSCGNTWSNQCRFLCRNLCGSYNTSYFPYFGVAAECSFSSMKRLKTSLRKTMTDERLSWSSLAILQYMLWFSFILGLNFISFCFKLVIIHYRTRKQREIKFEPSIKLNHNIFINTKMLMLITSQSLNLRNKRGGASPWACKHSSKSSKKNVLKAVFDITSCRKQGCKLPRYVLKVSKNVILYEVFETIWTRVRAYQNVYSTPLKGGRK